MVYALKKKDVSLLLTLIGLTIIHFVFGMFFLVSSANCFVLNQYKFFLHFNIFSLECNGAFMLTIIGLLHLAILIFVLSFKERVIKIGLF